MTTFLMQYGMFLAFSFFTAGATLSLILGSQKSDKDAWIVSHLFATVGALFGLGFGVVAFFSGETHVLRIASSIGIGPNVLTFYIDSLSALFIALISMVSITASIFGIGYYEQFLGKYRLGHFGAFYNMFLASMLLVVTANNAFLFLFAWEMMAITSYFLVIFERHENKNIKAGTLYILISQLGAGFLFAAFLFIYRYTGSWDFDVIRTFAGTIPFAMQNVVLALALVGFASKAGVIPLHIWLPEAHPAAPSHVSAIMSGVMIKTAIFMIVRFFIEFFPTASFTWGLIILSLGAISALLGILYALSEYDIKRLLAFSSVENIGIIMMGVGASITFFALGVPAAGVAALVAALYHTVNHAFFKSLLFLGAGSVAHSMHTRNMEKYGGVIRVMPWTAFFFLIGAVAISGIPPFNGFASEWLTFQSLFAGIVVLPTVPKIFMLLAASSLAFTGGLAAACFVKAFGVTFLSRPRSEAIQHAHEGSPFTLIAMGILAILTLVFGLIASSIAPLLARLVVELKVAGDIGPVPLINPAMPLDFGNFSSLVMVNVATAIIASTVATIIFLWVTAGRRKIVVSRTWDCGGPLTPRMTITSTGFSRSIMMVFNGLLRPTKQLDVEYHDDTVRYFTKAKTIYLSLPNFYHAYIYDPAVALVGNAARHTRRIQTGNVNTYLLYMFLTVMFLLYWALK